MSPGTRSLHDLLLIQCENLKTLRRPVRTTFVRDTEGQRGEEEEEEEEEGIDCAGHSNRTLLAAREGGSGISEAPQNACCLRPGGWEGGGSAFLVSSTMCRQVAKHQN